jgi:dolichol-phosphate mannosyltransferase
LEKLVIIPTYNEKDNVKNIIQAVIDLQQQFHILIIDDNSPDGTALIVQQLIQQYPNQLFLEQRMGKQGLGTAYIYGFKWAIKNGYQFIFEMDADFSHNPKHLQRLYDACKAGADVAVGSRYIKDGEVKNWPANRILLSKGASLYTRLITWMPVKDPTAGFICYKKEVLEAIYLDGIIFVGYAFQIEMKFAAWKLGFEIVEVPITFIDRQFGVSKMNKSIVKEGIFGVIKLRWLSMFKNYRKKLTNTNYSENQVDFQQQKIIINTK